MCSSSGLAASNFFAIHGITETTTMSSGLILSFSQRYDFAIAPNISCGLLHVLGMSIISENCCSIKFTQPGQHEVKIGSLPFPFILSTNSFASSTIVRSAAKLVSKIISNPSFLRAVTIFPVTTVPGSIPNISPSATLTAGAV